MTGVVLAECGGQVWLVGGDEHFNDVLHGTLPEGLEIEYVVVENRAAVFRMFSELSPQAEDGEMPWMINPALLRRIRGAFGPGRRSLRFTPWSVLLEAEAQGSVDDLAAWLKAGSGRQARLRQFAAAEPAPGHADLQRLRGQIVIGALQRAGVGDALLIAETMTAESDADVERMDLIEEAGPL